MPTVASSPDRILAEAQGLLRHVGELVKHGEDLQRATGEQFNLFQVLGVGHYEVSTHSALLASLLDPRGSHGQGPRFLECFIDVLKLEGSFGAASASVKTEASIGSRTDTTGGRLDILITERTRGEIAIESYEGATGPIFKMQSPGIALANACVRLGIPHQRLHDLRHFFATFAIESGVDIPTVAKWLGHKDGGALLIKTGPPPDLLT